MSPRRPVRDHYLAKLRTPANAGIRYVLGGDGRCQASRRGRFPRLISRPAAWCALTWSAPTWWVVSWWVLSWWVLTWWVLTWWVLAWWAGRLRQPRSASCST